jgi:hypothetical protein
LDVVVHICGAGPGAEGYLLQTALVAGEVNLVVKGDINVGGILLDDV